MKNILIVEDDEDDQILIKLALIKNGAGAIQIQFINQASEAAKMIVESPEPVALVLMDGNFLDPVTDLPQYTNGPEAVTQIRKTSDVYIVMTTTSEDLANQGLANGANEIITKDEIVKDARVLLPLLKKLIF